MSSPDRGRAKPARCQASASAAAPGWGRAVAAKKNRRGVGVGGACPSRPAVQEQPQRPEGDPGQEDQPASAGAEERRPGPVGEGRWGAASGVAGCHMKKVVEVGPAAQGAIGTHGHHHLTGAGEDQRLASLVCQQHAGLGGGPIPVSDRQGGEFRGHAAPVDAAQGPRQRRRLLGAGKGGDEEAPVQGPQGVRERRLVRRGAGGRTDLRRGQRRPVGLDEDHAGDRRQAQAGVEVAVRPGAAEQGQREQTGDGDHAAPPISASFHGLAGQGQHSVQKMRTKAQSIGREYTPSPREGMSDPGGIL